MPTEQQVVWQILSCPDPKMLTQMTKRWAFSMGPLLAQSPHINEESASRLFDYVKDKAGSSTTLVHLASNEHLPEPLRRKLGELEAYRIILLRNPACTTAELDELAVKNPDTRLAAMSNPNTSPTLLHRGFHSGDEYTVMMAAWHRGGSEDWKGAREEGDWSMLSYVSNHHSALESSSWDYLLTARRTSNLAGMCGNPHAPILVRLEALRKLEELGARGVLVEANTQRVWQGLAFDYGDPLAAKLVVWQTRFAARMPGESERNLIKTRVHGLGKQERQLVHDLSEKMGAAVTGLEVLDAAADLDRIPRRRLGRSVSW